MTDKNDDRLAGGGELPQPYALDWPEEGIITSESALALWREHQYDTGAKPLYTAEQVREYTAALRQRCDFLSELVEEQKRTIGALTMGCEHLGGTTPILRKLGELEHRAEQAERERDEAVGRFNWIATHATVETSQWAYWHDEPECTPLRERIDAALAHDAQRQALDDLTREQERLGLYDAQEPNP